MIEECLPCDVVLGDEIVSWEMAPGLWIPADSWLVVEITDEFIRGTTESDPIVHDMIALSWPYRVRVKAWDSDPADDHWNGTCPRCGRRTYQGFSSLDHDGDCV